MSESQSIGFNRFECPFNTRDGGRRKRAGGISIKIRALVTGVGGDVGQSIIKSLKKSKYDCYIVACDSSPRSAGFSMADKSYIVPKADDPDYTEKIIKICKKEKLEVIFVGTNQELMVLSKNKPIVKEACGAEVIAHDYDIVSTFMDKYKTCQFLKENKLPYPIFARGDKKNEIDDLLKKTRFPILIKPRVSSGSRDIHKIHDMEELNFFLKKVPNAIVQEYLVPEDEEYTCGIFSPDKGKHTYSIVMRRWLRAGATYKAIVEHDRDIENLCKKLASLLKLKGSINIQLRKTSRGLIIFEINPRFSSTACIRANMGFNDVEWTIDRIRGIKIKKPTIKKGIALRHWEEAYFPAEFQPESP